MRVQLTIIVRTRLFVRQQHSFEKKEARTIILLALCNITNSNVFNTVAINNSPKKPDNTVDHNILSNYELPAKSK